MPDPAIDHAGSKAITQEVADLTDRVIAERVRLEKGFIVVSDTDQKGTAVINAPARAPVLILPPIQIRGLAADVMTVKRGFAEIREIVRDVNLVSSALKQDLHDVKDQLQSHRQDIRFEAETLGNAGANDTDTKSE